MKEYTHIRGSVRPQDFLIQGNQVYIASDITPYSENVDGHTIKGFDYTWTVYDKDEYLVLLARENTQLRQEITDTQLALIELYEGELE